MAMAVRILGQTVRRRITSALVNPSVSFSSSSSSLQRRLPSSLWDAFNGISVSGNEGLFVKSDGLSLLIFGRFSRATTTGGGVHIRGFTTEVGTENATESSGDDPGEKTPAAATAPAVVMTPRSFQFTPVIRKMSDEIGYRVINRYTSEDFGRNKPPTAFAVVQVYLLPPLPLLPSFQPTFLPYVLHICRKKQLQCTERRISSVSGEHCF